MCVWGGGGMEVVKEGRGREPVWPSGKALRW